VHPDGLRTWAPTDAQNIRLFLEGNDKESFTIVTAITADRTKLLLSLIASGKTEAVEESHFGGVGYDRTDHSESGWTTCDTFCRWLAWLCGVYDDSQSIWLISDCYAVNRNTNAAFCANSSLYTRPSRRERRK
jgi:hypothetical protein